MGFFSFLFKEEKTISKTQIKKTNIPVVDSAKGMKKVQKILADNYQDFITYPAIQQIADEDRLPLMQYIWKHWDNRIDYEKLYAKYSQYNKEILNRIEKVESARCHMYLKCQEFMEEYFTSKTKTLVKVCPVGKSGYQYFCLVQNMYDVFEYYVKDTEDYEFSHFPNYIAHYGSILEDKSIFFFAKNKFIPMDKETLLKLCKDAGIKDVY